MREPGNGNMIFTVVIADAFNALKNALQKVTTKSLSLWKLMFIVTNIRLIDEYPL